MIDVPSPSGPQEPFPRFGHQPRIGYRRAFWISIGISAAIHLVAVLLYPSFVLEVPTGIMAPGGEDAPATPRGTELVNLAELSPAEAERVAPEEPEPEEPEEEVTRPGVAPTVPRPEVEGAPGEGTPRSHAEVLRPGGGDLRLWAPVDPSILELTEEQRMELELAWALAAMADSAEAAAEMAGRATDWTYTDEEGRRWGISPGKIHLGGITLPLPFGFGPPPEAREGIQERVWEWEEIERGSGSASMRSFWRNRAEAMRRRMEAERKPDTTDIRR